MGARSSHAMIGFSLALAACAQSHIVDAGPYDAGLSGVGESCIVQPCNPGLECIPEGLTHRVTCYGPDCLSFRDSECPTGFNCVGLRGHGGGVCCQSCSGPESHDCPGTFRCGHSGFNPADTRFVCAGVEWLP